MADGYVKVPESAPPKLPFLWVKDFGDLHKPPPLKWLLTDLRTRKPFLRAGECFVLAADGGTGKGYCVLELAVCVALKLELFGVFKPEQSGRVVLLVAEDQRLDVHHRLHRIANMLELNTEQIAALQERIAVMPLAGETVRLMGQDVDRNPAPLPALGALIKQLEEEARTGGFEWALVVLDPLARFGSTSVETDQSAATAFVQALEQLSARLPGKPAVCCVQHSSAASSAAGRANVRGVTGLRNAFRAALTLDAFEADSGLRGVRLTNDKNNLAPKARPLWLVRLEDTPLGGGRYLDTAGVLRAATEEETAELEKVAGSRPSANKAEREQTKRQGRADQDEAVCKAILTCLHTDTPMGRDELLGELSRTGRRMSAHTLKPFVARLIRDRLMVDLSDGKQTSQRRYVRSQNTPCEACEDDEDA